VREAEPAAAARWLFRALAGDAWSPARRIVAGSAIAILVVVSTVVALASVLAAFSLIALVVDRLGAPRATQGGPTVSWFLVAVTTTALVGLAVAVSWTSRRRALAREAHRADDRDGPVPAESPAAAGQEHPPLGP
jgi:hypothetical protein